MNLAEDRLAKIDAKIVYRKMHELGWDQKDLAKEAGLAEGTVSQILKGKPCRSSTASKIAAALGLQLEAILQTDESVDAEDDCPVSPHRVTGHWQGTYTLFLSLVHKLTTANGIPNEDETWPIEGRITAAGESGQAYMVFKSERAQKMVSLDSIDLKIVDGSKIILGYDREADEKVVRLGAGILELNSYGNKLTGFYTTCDPAFDGKLIPAFIDLKKVEQAKAPAENDSSSCS